VFSNYSPNNAPAGHWSLMAEVSESPQKPVEMDAIVEEVVSAFERCGFIDRPNVVSRWQPAAGARVSNAVARPR
jgi:protoporphyrinogen oxidase